VTAHKVNERVLFGSQYCDVNFLPSYSSNGQYHTHLCCTSRLKIIKQSRVAAVDHFYRD